MRVGPESRGATLRSRLRALPQPRETARLTLLTLLSAVLANLLLNVVQFGGDPGPLWRWHLNGQLGAFMLGSFVVWLVGVGLVALVGRLWLSNAILFSAVFVVGFASYQKLLLRQEPLYPSDLAFADNVSFLTQMVGLRMALLLLFIVVATVCAFALGARLLRRTSFSLDRPFQRRQPVVSTVLRVVVVVMCVSTLSNLRNFNEPRHYMREFYETTGARWVGAYQPRNYMVNGFVGGYLYNMPLEVMAKPAGYSRQTMSQIARRYTRLAEATNASRDADAIRDVNVVLVLAESFSDPLALNGVDLDRDPMPFTRRLMSDTTSGSTLTQKVSAGTANMEFEALTGMSLRLFNPRMDTPYQMLVQHRLQFPSAVGYFKELGHRTLAMHPFHANMYRRDRVYPVLGFDKFRDIESVRGGSKIDDNPFVTDQAMYDELLDELRRTSDPLFAHLVTIQNHYPYEGHYSSAGPSLIDQYAQGLAYSDKALKSLVSELDSLSEPTILVFYGDHLPPGYSADVLSQNDYRSLHETPFLIYANFTGRSRDLPTTSPTHFMSHVLDLAGAPLPAYYTLLRAVEKTIPAMQHGLMVGANNQKLSSRELTPRALRVLREYRLVQYDLSVGHGFVQDEMFYPLASSAIASSQK